jgi:predicted Zn finger-like uncharacterized protein
MVMVLALPVFSPPLYQIGPLCQVGYNQIVAPVAVHSHGKMAVVEAIFNGYPICQGSGAGQRRAMGGAVMAINIQCPGCQKKLKVKDELAGKRVKCPACGHVVESPGALPLEGTGEAQVPVEKWYFQLMGEVIGPVSFSQLKKYAQEGTVTPDMYVRSGESEDWVSADGVKGLFEAGLMALAKSDHAGIHADLAEKKSLLLLLWVWVFIILSGLCTLAVLAGVLYVLLYPPKVGKLTTLTADLFLLGIGLANLAAWNAFRKDPKRARFRLLCVGLITVIPLTVAFVGGLLVTMFALHGSSMDFVVISGEMVIFLTICAVIYGPPLLVAYEKKSLLLVLWAWVYIILNAVITLGIVSLLAKVDVKLYILLAVGLWWFSIGLTNFTVWNAFREKSKGNSSISILLCDVLIQVILFTVGPMVWFLVSNHNIECFLVPLTAMVVFLILCAIIYGPLLLVAYRKQN